MEPTQLKEALFQLSKAEIQKRIDSATALKEKAEESMMKDTKSSAGDKFETSRAMLQAEQERMKAVIIKTKALEHQLKNVDLTISQKVKMGSLVLTSGLNYFISVGLGKLEYEGDYYYAISGQSPIGQLLLGKSAGEQVSFNGKSFTIDQVF